MLCLDRIVSPFQPYWVTGVYVYACSPVTCQLHFLQNVTMLFYVLLWYYGDGMDSKVRVSTESELLRRESPAVAGGG